MITVAEAKNLIHQHASTGAELELDSSEVLGYVLSRDVKSPIDMPPFRQSAMDGYAVNLKAGDSYEIIGTVQAGSSDEYTLLPGQAVRIYTGARVPNDANAIIMQEHVTRSGDQVSIKDGRQPKFNDHIRSAGEQIQCGDLAMSKGDFISESGIGYLSGLGIQRVHVYQKPKVGIVVTGDELIPVGQTLTPGKVYESNGLALTASLQAIGIHDVHVRHVVDDQSSTELQIAQAMSESDIVIITGGISVGDYDYVAESLSDLNVEPIFYKVKQKPGKPLFFGLKSKQIVFALPGNPAAVMTTFYEYVYPAIQIMQGQSGQGMMQLKAKACNGFQKKGDRAQFLKAFCDGQRVEILDGQASSMMRSLASANALVYMCEDANQIQPEDDVEVHLFPSLQSL